MKELKNLNNLLNAWGSLYTGRVRHTHISKTGGEKNLMIKNHTITGGSKKFFF